MSNCRHLFKFPFYALTLKTDQERLDEWIDQEKYQVVCEEIISYVKKNGFDYFRKLERTVLSETKEFLDYSWNVCSAVPEMAADELAGAFHNFVCKYFWHYGPGCITFLYEHNLSERLSDSLAKRHDNVAELLGGLMKAEYKSFMAESEEMLFEIAGAKGNVRDKMADGYIRKYFFIDTSYRHKIELDKKKVLAKAKAIIKHGEQKSGAVEKPVKIKLSKEEEIIVGLLKSAEIVRDKRKQVAMAGAHVMLKFLDEIVRRKKLDLDLAKRAHWFEFQDLLDHPKETVERLKKRDYMSIVLDGNSFHYLDYIAIEPRTVADSDVQFFKGTPAAAGIYKGRVKIIVTKKDFPKMKKGDILVTDMTRPDYLPIMRLAGAIITDEGGLTCHAAVVSREMGIPCVVGTKIGTQVLHDGQRVEVDADRGVVKIVKN